VLCWPSPMKPYNKMPHNSRHRQNWSSTERERSWWILFSLSGVLERIVKGGKEWKGQYPFTHRRRTLAVAASPTYGVKKNPLFNPNQQDLTPNCAVPDTCRFFVSLYFIVSTRISFA
jgi:hypothetical protein